MPGPKDRLQIELNELLLFLGESLSDIPHERLERLFESLRKYIIEQDEKNAVAVQNLREHVDERMDRHEVLANERGDKIERRLDKLERDFLHALGNGIASEVKQLKKWVSEANTKFFRVFTEVKKMVLENTEWRKQQEWEQQNGAQRMDRRRTDRRALADRLWNLGTTLLAVLVASVLAIVL